MANLNTKDKCNYTKFSNDQPFLRLSTAHQFFLLFASFLFMILAVSLANSTPDQESNSVLLNREKKSTDAIFEVSFA